MSGDRVVVVTGASRGIGAAVVRRLQQVHATIVAVARSMDAPPDTRDPRSGGGAPRHVITADVADPAACVRVIAETLATFGRLDALVNNAGTLAPLARIADADPERWRHNLAVNLLGPFYLSQAAIPHLRRSRGRVVNISSGAAVKAIQGWSAYCVAKAGLTHFTRQLAVEEPEITTVALRPGVVDTSMQAQIRRDGPRAMTAARSAYFQQLKNRGELLDPDVPARAAAWLALHAPADLNGAFVDHDDPRLVSGAQAVFGP